VPREERRKARRSAPLVDGWRVTTTRRGSSAPALDDLRAAVLAMLAIPSEQRRMKPRGTGPRPDAASRDVRNQFTVPSMGVAGLSDEVERFLVHYVPTVGHLEAILLLRRDADRVWSVAQLAESLFVDKKKAGVIAAHLSEHGFVTDDGSGALRYAPSAALARDVDAVAASYRERLVAVSQFIHARQDAVNIRGFADAFRFRKD
jgi:hypothetical protein